MNVNSMTCNVKIGKDQYYAGEVNKYIIDNGFIIPVIALIIGALTLFYVFYKRSEESSVYLLIPLFSSIICLIFGSIQVDNYREAVNKTKETGRNCRPSP
jgi:hypothetical protein